MKIVESTKENKMDDKKSLCIEILDPQNFGVNGVIVREGDKLLGGITSLKFQASVSSLGSPVMILEASVPNPKKVSEGFGNRISETIETIERYGGSVLQWNPEDSQGQSPVVPQNPEEQKQAEATLRGIIR